MTGLFSSALIGLSLALAVWAAGLAVLNRAPNRWLVIGAGALELMLLVFLVGGIVQMIGTERDFARLEFVGYLLGLVAIPPLGVAWAWDERSRAGTIVMAVVFVVVPIMIVRTQQVFAGV